MKTHRVRAWRWLWGSVRIRVSTEHSLGGRGGPAGRAFGSRLPLVRGQMSWLMVFALSFGKIQECGFINNFLKISRKACSASFAGAQGASFPSFS